MDFLPQQSPITCCRDCAARHVGCHSSCASYAAEKAAHEEKREAMRKQRDQDWDYHSYRYASASRVLRNRPTTRRRKRK